jgi:hypothetical protein
MKIIHTTAVIEDLLKECVGDQPELVKLGDWRGMALRFSRRMEESGLRVIRHAVTLDDRSRLVGPIKADETVVVLAAGSASAIVVSTGLPLEAMPPSIQSKIVDDLMQQGANDLVNAMAVQREKRAAGGGS